MSLRYPSGWSTDQNEQDGVWYRYFIAPGGAGRRAMVSVTLLVSALETSLDEYARAYLAGARSASSADERRAGGAGKSWRFDSADGTTRHALLLLEPVAREGATRRVVGLHAQGPSVAFDGQRALLDAMAASLTLERAEDYPELQDARFGYTLRVPASWAETRHFGGAEALLLQWSSPALQLERGGASVHASLSLSIERLEPDATLAGFTKLSRERLGEAWQLQGQAAWGAGAVDNLRAETSLSATRQRRFYRVAEGRGYTLTCEARDDAFFRVARWCDLIAGTFRLRGESAGVAAP